MAKLIYSAITSLDGYISDASGDFDWAAPVSAWGSNCWTNTDSATAWSTSTTALSRRMVRIGENAQLSMRPVS